MNKWNKKPDSTNPSTGRWRAKKLIRRIKCAFKHPKECSKRLEIHHIDKNPSNNNNENLIVLCTTHHRFMESGKISKNNPRIPKYYVDKGGKRRYKKG